ncbi:hypothetical protein MAPG_05397, partial [Magnaporthiopsis poae ATCC 64411]
MRKVLPAVVSEGLDRFCCFRDNAAEARCAGRLTYPFTICTPVSYYRRSPIGLRVLRGWTPTKAQCETERKGRGPAGVLVSIFGAVISYTLPLINSSLPRTSSTRQPGHVALSGRKRGIWPIYTGVWRNYYSATGSTIILTVPQDVGAMLTAFLALFVSFSFGHLWSIICFVLHQVRSTPERLSGVYHQRQALLRNTTTAAATAWTSIKLAWVWKGHSRGVVGGSAALVSVAVSFVALLAAASLLSSKIQLVDGDVLLSGQECGWINMTDGSSFDKDFAKGSFRVWLYDRAERYSANCYGPEAASGPETGACGGFPANTIPVTSSTVPCPFGKAICAQPDAFQLDSGFIDSNQHLGINSPLEDRIRFRKVATCIPIQTEKYSTQWDLEPPASMWPGVATNKTKLPAGSFYKIFKLGPIGKLPHTWVVSNRTQYVPEDRGSPFIPYQLSAVRSTAAARRGNITSAGWYPIPELTVPDADVTLLILRNDAKYSVPISDPWFRSTSKTDLTGAGRQGDGYFMSDQTCAAVACTEKYQLCNLTACTSLAGLPFGYPNWAVELNARQRAAVDLLGEAEYGAFGPLVTYGSLTPRASDLLYGGYGSIKVFNYNGLPPDQWRTEVSSMFNTTLAAMQLLASAQAAPPDISCPASMARRRRRPASRLSLA